MSELKKYKLGDVAQIIGGGTPSTTKEEYWNGEIGWLTPRDLTGYSFKYISKGERNITDEGLKNSSARLMPEGTVLMTSRAPIGYLAIAGDELCTNQGFKSFIVDEDKINNEYLYYLLKSNIDRIKSLGTGSTFAEVSASILKSFEIKIPDLPTQTQIAQILTSLDDKIELNLQMNQTLEAMAQAIFKEWFVDFKFPGFDGELVDGLPKGWRMATIGQLCKITTGKLDANARVENGLYRFYTCAKNYYFINDYAFDTEAILVSGNGEYVGYINYYKGKFNAYQRTYVLSDFKLPVTYIKCFLELFLKERILNHVRGSSTPYIVLGTLSNFEIITPNDNMLKEFNVIADKILLKIEENKNQIQTLTQTRDSLLPRLMSGKIEIQA